MSAAMQELKQAFQNATTKYSLAPLWYWNDEMGYEEMARQIQTLKDQDINEFMIFPISGMTVPYLSEEYYDKFKFCVREFEKRGMKLWVYDEYNWPSGLGGGMINDLYPEYLMKMCRFYRYEVGGKKSSEISRRLPEGNVVFAEARKRGGSKVIDLRDILGGTTINWKAPAGEWDITLGVVQTVQSKLDTVTMARWASNAGGYLDVMSRDAVAKYIDTVYEGHYQHAKEEYGKTIVGYFTDEPGVWYDWDIYAGRYTLHQSADGHGAGKGLYTRSTQLDESSALYGLHSTVPWTYNAMEQFKERNGYDLRPHMWDLTDPSDKSRKVCRDYFHMVSDLFASNYCEQIANWCGKHKVAYSGHYGEGIHQGDYYKQVRPQQVPGIDMLGHWTTSYRRISWPKRVASVARQWGRDKVLCETNACSPWTNTLADRIEEADILTIQGINLHASIDFTYSYRGIRKYASNPPGFYHSPRWKYQGGYSRHVSRLCAMISAGKSAVKTAVYHASEAAISNTLLDHNSNLAIDRNVIDTLYSLYRSQIDADVLFETALLEDLKITKGEIAGKDVKYRYVVVPDVKIMHPRTVELLAQFVKTGGTLVWQFSVPTMAPDGSSLEAAWKKHFGSAPKGKIKKDGNETLGQGQVIYLSNPADAITLNEPLHTGTTLQLFDDTDSMICMSPYFPHWISLDLGAKREVSRIESEVEDIKSGIDYEYVVEASDDGKNWKPVAKTKTKGQVHTIGFSPVKTRHVRLHINTDSKRLYSAHHLRVSCANGSNGSKKIENWKPPMADPRRFASVIPGALPDVVWYEGDEPSTALAMNYRRVNGASVYNFMNITTTKRHLWATPGKGQQFARWNLDTGKVEPVAVDEQGRLRVVLEQNEAISLVATQEKVATGAAVDLDPNWKPVRELKGPWKVQPERQNAFPLAAGKVELRDADWGTKWFNAPEARMVDELRLMPNIAFRATFTANHVDSKAQLLLEKHLYFDVKVNGKAVTGEPKDVMYFDCHNYVLPIGKLLKQGKNVIEGLWRPEMYERQADGQMYLASNTQPAVDLFVLGDFGVKSNKIVAPVTKLKGDRWEDQGFSYYSGTMSYDLDLGKLDKSKTYGLEIDSRRCPIEVVVGGKTVETILKPPFVIDLSKHLKNGNGKVTVKVTNTIASLFSAFHMGECFNQPIKNLASGLKSVTLLELVD